ncbi:MAG: radical SAM protein [Verrucomicrobiales bacterium]
MSTMQSLLRDREHFASRRGSEHLVFSGRTRNALVLSRIEYAVFDSLRRCDPGVERTAIKEEAASQIAAAAERPAGDCRRWIDRLESKLVAGGILPDGSGAYRGASPPAYPQRPLNLQAIYLHLTNRCNLKCLYCYNADYRLNGENAKAAELSDAELRDAIDQAADLGALSYTFSGGEPLLRKSAPDLGRFVIGEKRGFVELLTNGTLLHRRDPDEILASFSKIVVSLDSHLPQIHDALRGKGSHGEILKGLRLLGTRDPDRVVLRPVLHRMNLPAFADFIRYAYAEFGIRQVRFSTFVPRHSKDDLIPHLFIRRGDYEELFEAHRDALEDIGVEVETEELCVEGGCGAGGSVISIGACGEVFPCQAMHDDSLIAGNLRERSLADICRGGESLEAMRTITPDMIDECRDCSLASICGGGCRANAFENYGSLYRRNRIQCALDAHRCEQALWGQVDRQRRRAAGASASAAATAAEAPAERCGSRNGSCSGEGCCR